MIPRERARFRRGAYLIPSLFTTGNLLCGYIALVRSIQGEFEWAAIALFIAALLDRVDGWVARLTGTSSDFGVQFDSLADVISFGIAPALLAAVRRERPDLVLLDLRMPGIDGVEVLKRIRDIDAGIAVIMISGAGDLADASAALASGVLARLQKPVDLQQLKQLVGDVLGRSQSPGQ